MCVCVYLLSTHHLYQYLRVNTVCWNMCICVCLSTPCIFAICYRVLAAFLFKPQCPSCATSTTERPIVYSRSVCYFIHMMHMVFALRTALEISWAVVFRFFVFFSPIPSSVGITARLGLFVSLAYHRSGSLAVMLRA